MPDYAILRTKKLKTRGGSTVVGAASHVSRERETKNADPGRRGLNRQLFGFEQRIPSAREFNEEIQRRLDGVHVRKDAVLCQELLISASPEYFKKDPMADAFSHETMRWLKRQFKDYLVGVTLHLDEQTPHIHAFVTCVKEGKLKNGKLIRRAATTTLFKPDTMNAMQTSFADAVGGLGLRRGVENSKAVHTAVAAYYKRVNEGNEIARKLELYGNREFVPPAQKLFEFPSVYAQRVATETVDYTRKMGAQAAKIAAARQEAIARAVRAEETAARLRATIKGRIRRMNEARLKALGEAKEALRLAQEGVAAAEARAKAAEAVVAERIQAADIELERRAKAAEKSAAARIRPVIQREAKQEAESRVRSFIDLAVEAKIRAERAEHAAKEAEARADREARSARDAREDNRRLCARLGQDLRFAEVLIKAGYQEDAQAGIHRFKDSCVSVSSDEWVDITKDKRGHTAVALVQHLLRSDFGSAVAWISSEWGKEVAEAAVRAHAGSAVRESIAGCAKAGGCIRTSTADARALDYLGKLQFDREYLASLFESGRVHGAEQRILDKDKQLHVTRYWCVFPHNALEDGPVASTLRALDSHPLGRLSVGEKKLNAFTLGWGPCVEEIAFVEDPLDVLAYRQLYPAACVIACEGGEISSDIARAYLDSLVSVEVVVAFVADPAGDSKARAAVAALSALTARKIHRVIPEHENSWVKTLEYQERMKVIDAFSPHLQTKPENGSEYGRDFGANHLDGDSEREINSGGFRL